MSDALPVRDVVRSFRGVTWASEDEMLRFVGAFGALSPQEVVGCLGVVAHESSRTPPHAHLNRLRVFKAMAERSPDPSLFVPFAQALRVEDPSLRAVLVDLLPRVNHVPAHVELCRMIGAPEPAVRAAAAEVLGRVGGKAAFETLWKLCRDPAFGGRIDALNLMVPKARQLATPLIEAVLRAGKPPERQHALALLADIRFFPSGTTGCNLLAGMCVSDDDERTAALALVALGMHADEDEYYEIAQPFLASESVPRVRMAIEGLRRYATPKTAAVLSQKLLQGPNAIRTAAIDAAQIIGTDAMLPVFVEALTHEQIGVKSHALEAISHVAQAGRLDFARAVIWLLRSRDKNLRRMAVEIVNRVGDPGGDLAPRLLRYLRDEDWWVRERTMDALIETHWPGLTRHILKYLRDPSEVVRRFATNALRRIGDPAALPDLLKLASSDPDWWVREEAVAAAAATKDERVVPFLVKLMTAEPELRLACVEALRQLGASGALADIAALTTDPDPDVRGAAITVIGELGGPDLGPSVEAAADDEVPRVRQLARELLLKWKLRESTSTQHGQLGLDELLSAMAACDADDLLLFGGRTPYIKRRGQVEAMPGFGVIKDEALRRILIPHLSPVQRADLERAKDVDFSTMHKGLDIRFRVNLFTQATGVGAVFRIVRNDALLMVLDNLGLPAVISTFADQRDGLVIVGGPTGAGKSTTLAAMVDRINRTTARHVLTIEDPIETIHFCDRSLLTQREVGSHTPSFSGALRAALRQDPDVILVGEMRDLETMAFAVTAAETGHLVLATLHTGSAETSITRMISAFPAPQQPQVRAMLAGSLRGVVCQHLLRRKDAEGRVVAAEILVNTEAVAGLIRKGKEFQIGSLIQTGRAAGMQPMDPELARLVKEGVVTYEEAYSRANDKVGFEQLVTGKPPVRVAEASQPLPGAQLPPRVATPTPAPVDATHILSTRVLRTEKG